MLEALEELVEQSSGWLVCRLLEYPGPLTVGFDPHIPREAVRTDPRNLEEWQMRVDGEEGFWEGSGVRDGSNWSTN